MSPMKEYTGEQNHFLTCDKPSDCHLCSQHRQLQQQRDKEDHTPSSLLCSLEADKDLLDIDESSFVRNTTHNKSKLELFCDLSSIRGVQRIYRSKIPFIRLLWLLFVISMTCVLMVSSGFLISDYLRYSTAWNARTLLDDKSEFPAVTLCAHNPFTLDVNRLWKEKIVPSPKEIKLRVRDLLKTMQYYGLANNTGDLAFSDTIEFYYANLNSDDTIKVGHDKDMLYHCMLYEEGTTVVAEKCELEPETSIRIRRFTHPKYFNCWTIEGKPNASTADITRLIILARLVPLKKIEDANTSFITDSFTRGEGIKVVIHERDTYPEIEKHGVNIQPGRMNEVNYATLFWKRLHTPVAPCAGGNLYIEDLGVQYTYTQTQCLNLVLQNELFKRCGCLNSEWPRSIKLMDSNHFLPYCQKLPADVNDKRGAEEMKARLECLSTVLVELKQIKETAIQKGVCLPLCGYYTYNTKLSVTSWDPDPHKLALYTKVYRHVDKFLTDPSERGHFDELLKVFDESVDPTQSGEQSSSTGTMFSDIYQKFDDGKHTYISLIRQDFDTTMNEERLVFDIYILISRIGGLCSLCIGLTMAFIVELVEFFYLLCCKNNTHFTESNEIKKLSHSTKCMTVNCPHRQKEFEDNQHHHHHHHQQQQTSPHQTFCHEHEQQQQQPEVSLYSDNSNDKCSYHPDQIHSGHLNNSTRNNNSFSNSPTKRKKHFSTLNTENDSQTSFQPLTSAVMQNST
uniref:Acid-sensing ion channel 1 n=1 Tax=Trichobilharzia regenti TaxID=157069 RepID=A0AA85JS51_TRIRE|nr:unnamed protein product [Trichobilharzia regenti]